MIEFKLPSLGTDMEEGKLLEWKALPGDKVKRGDIVAVVDTSKAAVDIEIWEDGTMHEHLVQPGQTVPVGTVLALLLAPGEEPSTAVRPKADLAAPVGTVAPAVAPAPVPAAPPPAARRRVSPAARKHAEEHDVDLDAITGTGPGGAVTVEDVEKYSSARSGAESSAQAVAPEAQAATGKRAEIRRAIAAAMTRSNREIPHYYLSEAVPLLAASQWLAQENASRPVAARLLMSALQLKAVALAIRKYPDLNGWHRDGAYQPATAVNVGVAISLREGGLIAPAIHRLDELTLSEAMARLSDLVKRARAGSLRSSEMSDPTVTVTNLGEGGVDAVFPLIYPPQVAIVGFGRPATRPWGTPDGGLSMLPVVVASLGADHRVSDGHRGALFLAEVARLLQQPEKL